MSISCPYGRIWLHKTLSCWLQESCRSVSTTSAIKRGLRATKEAEGANARESREGRDVARSSRRVSRIGIREDKIKKFVSGGERSPDTRWEFRGDSKSRTQRNLNEARKSPHSKAGPLDRSVRTQEFANGGAARPQLADRRRASARRGRERSHTLPASEQTSIASNAPSQSSAGWTEDINRDARERITERRSRGSPSRTLERIERELPAERERSFPTLTLEREKRHTASEIPVSFRASVGVQKDHGRSERQESREQNESKAKCYLPKAHPELHSILSHLEGQIDYLKTSGLIRYRHSKGLPEEQTLTRICDMIQSLLLDKINEKMESGEWRKRYVRSTLNDRKTALHFQDPEADNRRGKYIWFDYENARLEMAVKRESSGTAVQPHEDEEDGVQEIGGQNAIQGNVEPQHSTDSTSRRRSEHNKEDEQSRPLGIPYSTAASTFLYGTNTVIASLKAQRRTFYKLYLQRRLANESRFDLPKDLAKNLSLPIHHHTPPRLLDKMSQDRPHNGIVLEASRFPAPPVLSIGKLDRQTQTMRLHLAHQSSEDIAVNGTPSSILSASPRGKYPLIVLLDGITDPGNVGAILRTLHFYGVTAAAIATNTCANLDSAVLAKASSGACEVLQILALPGPSAFVHEARKEGWKIFAAVAPEASSSSSSRSTVMVPSSPVRKSAVTTSQLVEMDPLAKYPCILMLGAEGEGLRENLKHRADHFVTIEGGRRPGEGVDVGVDSLNVSTAAGVLVEAFMKKSVSTSVAEGRTGRARPRRLASRVKE